MLSSGEVSTNLKDRLKEICRIKPFINRYYFSRYSSIYTTALDFDGCTIIFYCNWAKMKMFMNEMGGKKNTTGPNTV